MTPIYATAAKLHAAGVPFAIRSQAGGPSAATALRNLPYEAATAVAFGLPEDAAVQAVTIAPARILGVADQVGSIEAGKRANLVVTAGHVLQPTTTVLALFIDGEPHPAREPAYPALCQVSPAAGGGPHRPGTDRDRTGRRAVSRPSVNRGRSGVPAPNSGIRARASGPRSRLPPADRLPDRDRDCRRSRDQSLGLCPEVRKLRNAESRGPDPRHRQRLAQTTCAFKG